MRVLHLLLFLLALFSIVVFVEGRIFVPTGDTSIWLHCGLLMIIIGMFWIEKYFTKPADVVVNTLIVFISISTLNNPPLGEYWTIIKYYALVVMIISFIIVWLGSPANPEKNDSKIKKFFYHLTTSVLSHY